MLKKVLFIIIVVICATLAQGDYVLMQKFSRPIVKFYDITWIGMTDWAAQTVMLCLLFWAFVRSSKIQQTKLNKVMSFVVAVCFGTVLVPVIVTLTHVTFFGKGNFGNNLFDMLRDVSLKGSALLAHCIVSLVLVAIGFMYIFYFPKQAKETKNKLETAPDLGTNEDG